MFQLVIWSVEHGSAAYIETPDGRVIVLDAGRSDGFSPAAYVRSLPALQAPGAQLDHLIVSHPHQDHIADLSIFGEHLPPRVFVRNRLIPPRLVYPPGRVAEASVALQWYQYFDTWWTAPVTPGHPGFSGAGWPTYGGVELDVFANSPVDFAALGVEPTVNDLSLLTCVRYRGLSVIFPGDLEPVGQYLLLRRPDVAAALAAGTTRILIAPHHGRRSGIAVGENVYSDFLLVVRPHLVIMSEAWGCERSCPELYQSSAIGLDVWCLGEPGRSGIRRVVTTKTNEAIVIRLDCITSAPFVCVP